MLNHVNVPGPAVLLLCPDWLLVSVEADEGVELLGTTFELCVVVGADVDRTDGGRGGRGRLGSVIRAVKYESHNKTI